MNVPEIFRLTEGERNSALWQRLEAHLVQRLAEKRAQNDHSLTSDETARLRGAIAELKYLLDRATPGPAIDVDAGS